MLHPPGTKSTPISFNLLLTLLVFSALQLVRGSIDTKQSREGQALVASSGSSETSTQHGKGSPVRYQDALQTATTTSGRDKQQPLSPASLLRLSEAGLQRNKCQQNERELDRCSAQLIGLGQSTSTSYPDSMQELNSVFCPRFRETVACIKNNTQCYKPFEKQVINWILTSTRRMNYKRCKNENEKQRFLRLTNACFASMKSPMDKCMTRYIEQLDAIAEYNRDLERLSENDFQIQLACCANRRFKSCIMTSAKQTCQSHESLKKLRRTNSVSSQRVARKHLARVTQDTMDDLRSTLDEMALTGPDFICTGVDENFCRSRFDGRYSNRATRHKSIVPAMIKIYANK